MKMLDNLKDVLKHTHNLGFIDVVKLDQSGETTEVEAIANDKSVVMYGELRNEIEGLDDNVIGLGRLAVLNGYVSFPPFQEDGASIKISSEKRNGEETPSGLNFSDGNGHTAHYRFMSKEMAEEQIKVPRFKGAKWDIEFEPTKENIKDMQYFNQILGSYEPTFGVTTKDKNLSFVVGSGSSDVSVIPICSGIEATIDSEWRWPLDAILSIIKLGLTSECKAYISNQGALKLDIDSGLGKYEYVLPAKK